MLKLTRHLYAWEPRAAYFDYYEGAHLNHIMAQHNAETGMFAYMVPLMAGTHREWSKPTDDFWCCVGTGMESHSKHGDSVFWTDGETLFVNQFVSASLNWVDRRTTFELKAGYHSEWPRKSLHVITAVHPTEFAVAIRVPAWCTELNGVLVDPCVTVNGVSVQAERRDDYAVIRRVWRSGDVVGIELLVSPRFEPTHDDNSIGAILFGPTVLAASLGQSDTPFAGSAPALVTDDEEAFLGLASDEFSVFQSSLMKPQSFVLAPFRWMSDRNTAVYFRRFTNAEWATEQKRVADEAARIAALNARSIDIVKLGDETDEKAHDLTSKISYALSYRFRKGRDARDGGYFEFQMKAKRGPLALRATYWGDERDKLFHISVDRMRIATVQQDGTGPIAFIDRDYPIPPELTHGKRKITVRFEPAPKSRVTPVYGVRLLPA